MENVDNGTFLAALCLALFAIGILVSLAGRGMHRNLQNAAIWGLIFLGTIAGFGMWEDIKRDIVPRQAVFEGQGRIEVPRAFDGHYYLTLDINEVPTEFVIDTGASEIVLTKSDAQAAGLEPESLNYIGRASTANGEVRTAPVRLDSVAIGSIADRNMPAYVNEGEMFQSLLGMAYLQRWERIEITDGLLILTR